MPNVKAKPRKKKKKRNRRDVEDAPPNKNKKKIDAVTAPIPRIKSVQDFSSHSSENHGARYILALLLLCSLLALLHFARFAWIFSDDFSNRRHFYGCEKGRVLLVYGEAVEAPRDMGYPGLHEVDAALELFSFAAMLALMVGLYTRDVPVWLGAAAANSALAVSLLLVHSLKAAVFGEWMEVLGYTNADPVRQFGFGSVYQYALLLVWILVDIATCVVICFLGLLYWTVLYR